jgi:hypothetical protein
MERPCRQQGGLFPLPSDIRFACSCPDHASMCKRVAAVLYGIGARLDHKPDLLFRLRAVDETELLFGIDAALPLSKTRPAAGKLLEADDVSALFGLDMAVADVPAAGSPSGKADAMRTRRTPPVPERVAPVANAVVPRTIAPKRTRAAMPAAKRVSAKQAAAGKKSPVKPYVRKQAPAATKANPTRSSAPRRTATAKASSRPVVPEAAPANPATKGLGQQSAKTHEPADAYHRAKSASVAIPKALNVPLRDRGGRSTANAKTSAIRKSKQKPVKWW